MTEKKTTMEVVKEPEPELKIIDVTLNPIHLACIADDLRPNFRLIEIRKNIATATNGNVMVKLDLSVVTALTPDQLKILDGKFIDMEVWKEMSKCDALEIDEDHITCNKKGINKIFEYSDPQGEFFKIDNILLDIKSAGEDKKRIVAYNPRFITMLGTIFGSADHLIFSFTKGNLGTLVFPSEDCGMFAVLMPVLVDGGVNRYFFL